VAFQSLKPLINVDSDDDFWVLAETEGMEVAMAYVVGKNCIDTLVDLGQLDWISELLNYGEDTIGLEELAAEAGDEKL
jgi:hypothetical protein